MLHIKSNLNVTCNLLYTKIFEFYQIKCIFLHLDYKCFLNLYPPKTIYRRIYKWILVKS